MTHKEIQDAIDATDAIFKALPKTKQGEYLGELNTVMLILEQTQRILGGTHTEKPNG